MRRLDMRYSARRLVLTGNGLITSRLATPVLTRGVVPDDFCNVNAKNSLHNGEHGRSRRRFLQHAAGAAMSALLMPCAALRAQTGLPVRGVSQPELAEIDDLMALFVQDQRIPGAALAIAREGRLIHARGFGWADREARQAVEPTALFRAASLSKPLTATAVLRLAERGRLALDAGVWQLLGLPEPADARWKRVTILHLLQHTGGWDRDAARFDPMFNAVFIAKAMGVPPPATQRQIIRFMLARPLDFEPGSRRAYSNFGYCLLGRVIEHAAGMAYGEYMRQAVLDPLGIRRMRLGRTLRAQRAAGEVVYYDGRENDPDAARNVMSAPYGAWSLEAMDANGGWLASAVDLVRFACAFDDPAKSPLLGADSIARMFARPEGEAGREEGGYYYGCGWWVRPASGAGRMETLHSGLLPGTAAYLMRRRDGTNWAALFNTMRGTDGRPLDEKVHHWSEHAFLRVRRWPAVDQFPELL
jgi:N-acyl-D-amino-acid deacylase